MQLSHVCFSTADLPKTIEFYRSVFGFEVAHEFINDRAELYGVFLRISENTFLEFFNLQGEFNPGTQFKHFCMIVSDIHSEAERLRKLGFEIEVKRGRTDGILQFWIEDPNGIKIEMHHAGRDHLGEKYGIPTGAEAEYVGMDNSDGLYSAIQSGDLIEDPKAKTLSFFSRKGNVCVDQSFIGEMKKLSEERSAPCMRVSLHAEPSAIFHDMIILQSNSAYFPPHKHESKEETCHIMEGEVGVFTFDDSGTVTNAFHLGNDAGKVCRIGTNTWHTVIPLSTNAIYHESKPGPFLLQNDSIYPDWLPAASDKKSQIELMQRLTGLLQVKRS